MRGRENLQQRSDLALSQHLSSASLRPPVNGLFLFRFFLRYLTMLHTGL